MAFLTDDVCVLLDHSQQWSVPLALQLLSFPRTVAVEGACVCAAMIVICTDNNSHWLHSRTL